MIAILSNQNKPDLVNWIPAAIAVGSLLVYNATGIRERLGIGDKDGNDDILPGQSANSDPFYARSELGLSGYLPEQQQQPGRGNGEGMMGMFSVGTSASSSPPPSPVITQDHGDGPSEISSTSVGHYALFAIGQNPILDLTHATCKLPRNSSPTLSGISLSETGHTPSVMSINVRPFFSGASGDRMLSKQKQTQRRMDIDNLPTRELCKNGTVPCPSSVLAAHGSCYTSVEEPI
jgi:hypothetical protein